MSDEKVIQVNGVWKRYGLPFMPQIRKKLDAWRKRERSIDAYGPWSLKDVSFDVKNGETVGIIGHNGAGKSTLLKVLAGVTPTTQGDVGVDGRIFPMIELNAGLHSELTGRQNVFMLGAVMGLTRPQIQERMEKIKEFSDLKEWFDRPIRKYSSGMLARLGFSVAIHVDADLLLIDEVLSVGDITFQRKCFDHMERLQSDRNTSMVFVSHSIRQVERLCERILLLDKGNVIAFGEAGDVISEYYERSNTNIIKHRTDDGKTIVGNFVENALIEIDEIRLINKDGTASETFQTWDSLQIEIHYHTSGDYDDVAVGIGIATVDSFYIAGMSSEDSKLYHMSGKGVIRCTIDRLPLMSGIYLLHVKLRNAWGTVYGGGHSLKSFSITTGSDDRLSSNYGVIGIDVRWEDTMKLEATAEQTP